MARPGVTPLEAESRPCRIAIKKQGPQSSKSKEQNSADTLNERKGDYFPELLDKNPVWPTLISVP